MRRILITMSLLLSGFLQANIINLECTYYKSYNWNKSETRKPPSDSLSLRLDKSKKEIEESGIESSILNRVIRLIDFSEYKRRQAPLGVKITSRGFGKDRRYPITNKFLK